MKNNVLYSQIKLAIDKIPNDENCIVVLRGIPISVVDPENQVINIESIIDDKLTYLINIHKKKRRYITYEEYLLMKELVLAQYESVYIINNNLYMSLFPIYAEFSEDTRQGMITHFADSENDDDDTPITGNHIKDIISIFEGIKEYHGTLIGAYCCDDYENDPRLHVINAFETIPCEIQGADDEEINKDDLLDIQSESDYVELVKRIFEQPDEIFVKMSNFDGDMIRLKEHISILASYWSDYTDIYVLRAAPVKVVFEHRTEYTQILKKFWGYDQFRNFSVYDLDKLNKGTKTTKQVSQEQIISDIVQQVENCGSSEREYRDIFVTAPTGAGKSVIFQVPAIYLAEKYDLLTIVISPLIGLMNDQVNGLEQRNYRYAKTINSDISPIVKEDILNNVAEGNLHILYLSPETLLARSDVEQLIGDRTIGMIVIDEAHIVTTWGKQFRPDYWYLGDHISKLRRNQIKRKGRSFVISTFTATAIYHGVEDMYEETRNSLHMIDPITYLGYVKRNDIDIKISRTQKQTGERHEYDIEKIEIVEELIKRAVVMGKKTLIYFPTVNLIRSCFEYLENKHMVDSVTTYFGPLSKDEKEEHYRMFLSGEKFVMFATKAFGMGIDINDIEIVSHYAPTGNVCDYVQEIGRAARRSDLKGEACYVYDNHDFKYINRLHGLSSIKKYQLIQVISKIIELDRINRVKNIGKKFTKKTNAMLVDAENFTYIFDSPISESDDNINKVKTALLIIQKDFEARYGFSPITVRPIPLFSIGYFEITSATQKKLNQNYYGCCTEIYAKKHICEVNLQEIWNKRYRDKSFPQFKYLLYSGDKELEFNNEYIIRPALCVKIHLVQNYSSQFSRIWSCLKKVANNSVISQKYICISDFIDELNNTCKIKQYKAQAICEVIIASMRTYSRSFGYGANSIFQKRELNSGEIKYQFKTAVHSYFNWVENEFNGIVDGMDKNIFYLTNSTGKSGKKISTILGILEAIGVLTFEMSGGANSQLYIYMNQIRSLLNIQNNPNAYNNRLLEIVAERHLISVQMLTYIYEGGFKSDEIWDIIEDYFLGKIPERVKSDCRKKNPNIIFPNE